ncbi:2-C-methyl-D-erythritol 4-phosphate cytidylyltransferase [Mucilaginibacter sp. L196]|uniref:2-C-methyl-D-erythritol 4-phosphate cytidylyltransferase n=1 Tax=Mucilaginibacter sp. L196 TaxID=1641870 RepID=UPI00131ECD62|nr:2-C-methyl-D-erythritol 4-phosphate cytidylyltransferase [Mucilaginibacter sp. L196]
MSAPDLKSQISNPTSNFAIIVAGGSGTRMQAALPKQFLLLNGLPILMHTLQAFHNTVAKPELILALHADYHELWLDLCAKYNFTLPHQLIKGGETRFHSVKSGLNIIEDTNAVIAIHDAVRPLTAASLINNSFTYAAGHGNAITAVKSRDSVRQMQGDHSVSLLRDDIYLVQTPQTFKWSVLQKAYDQAYDIKFTDDASVVESSGVKINLIEGSYENIKITFPEDIAIAEAILNQKPSA